jgi:signal transduction histidine kinase
MAENPPTPRLALHSLVQAFTLRRIGLALGLALLVALLLNPLFVTPFPVVLGRLVVVSVLLLVVFNVAGQWPPPGLPRWLSQVLAVVLATPLATLLVYLPAVGGDARQLMEHEGFFNGIFLITFTALVIGPLLALGALYRERDAQARNQLLRFELERSQLEKQALDAQLRLLHAQIEPHFLFNTLANVQQLVEAGSPRAAPVLKSLIAYLRAAMPQLNDQQATLGSELGLVRAYLELMHMRMPDRLVCTFDVPAELTGQRFPAMALLTLVENAIHHGIDPSEDGGRITVRAWREGGDVVVAVADSGVGLSEDSAPGTGLANLRARLAAFYGPGARLDLLEQVPSGVCAQIRFKPATPGTAP